MDMGSCSANAPIGITSAKIGEHPAIMRTITWIVQSITFSSDMLDVQCAHVRRSYALLCQVHFYSLPSLRTSADMQLASLFFPFHRRIDHGPVERHPTVSIPASTLQRASILRPTAYSWHPSWQDSCLLPQCPSFRRASFSVPSSGSCSVWATQASMARPCIRTISSRWRCCGMIEIVNIA